MGSWPAEVFRHAEGHFHEDGDTDRRLALIGFDNAIEVCVDTFVGLHPRHRGGYEIRVEERPNILRNYHTKMSFLERYATERGLQLGEVSVDDVIWYHELRNERFTRGTGWSPNVGTSCRSARLRAPCSARCSAATSSTNPAQRRRHL